MHAARLGATLVVAKMTLLEGILGSAGISWGRVGGAAGVTLPYWYHLWVVWSLIEVLLGAKEGLSIHLPRIQLRRLTAWEKIARRRLTFWWNHYGSASSILLLLRYWLSFLGGLRWGSSCGRSRCCAWWRLLFSDRFVYIKLFLNRRGLFLDGLRFFLFNT